MEKPQRATRARFCRLLTAGLVAALLAGCAGESGLRRGSNLASYRHITIDASKRQDVALTAMGLIGTRYRYGGSSPDSGFDCSGLIGYVFENATRHALPHNTEDIAAISRPVPRGELNVGDFVFFNTLHHSYSHMGIYVGNGQFVNAPSTGGRVRIDSLHSPYFARRYEGARTLFQE
ncbi:C40 family peptidase [Candidimonas humi]|jgi:cell wall-associated NlpC family hydrolase|uniref:C40 family peptidase n=1 Tax=Candidimonas humi TaxID=683355 RepID=A0ABV8NW91_9BURK|nr:C40 family peptidase [Candidimonas humi]MBV6305919.1 C40 family peptidase [Candidimonas humi]